MAHGRTEAGAAREKERLKAYNAAHRPEQAERRRAQDRSLIERTMFNGAKHRARRDGMEFEITVADIVVPLACPYLEIELAICPGVHCATSPSLDRIDTARGYVPGNVEVISYAANRAKGALTIEELVVFAQNVLRKHV